MLGPIQKPTRPDDAQFRTTPSTLPAVKGLPSPPRTRRAAEVSERRRVEEEESKEKRTAPITFIHDQHIPPLTHTHAGTTPRPALTALPPYTHALLKRVPNSPTTYRRKFARRLAPHDAGLKAGGVAFLRVGFNREGSSSRRRYIRGRAT